MTSDNELEVARLFMMEPTQLNSILYEIARLTAKHKATAAAPDVAVSLFDDRMIHAMQQGWKVGLNEARGAMAQGGRQQ